MTWGGREKRTRKANWNEGRRAEKVGWKRRASIRGREETERVSRQREPADGGGGGIRTPEALSSLTVFKTAAFNRSATPPSRSLQGAEWKEQLGIASMDLGGVKRKWEIENRKEKLEKERTGESRKDRGINWEEGARGVREQWRG